MIGLIGGLGVNAGVYYYERLVERYRAMNQPLPLVIAHADLSTVLHCVQTSDRNKLARYMASIIESLARAGASCVAITAVAPHMCISELASLSPLPIVDILGVVEANIIELPYKRVAIFGNRAVVDSRIYGTLPDALVVSDSRENAEAIHEVYNSIALRGLRAPGPEASMLEARAHHLIAERGAEAIILAGTDLSSFYAKTLPSYPFVDVASWHLAAIEKYALSDAR